MTGLSPSTSPCASHVRRASRSMGPISLPSPSLTFQPFMPSGSRSGSGDYTPIRALLTPPRASGPRRKTRLPRGFAEPRPPGIVHIRDGSDGRSRLGGPAPRPLPPPPAQRHLVRPVRPGAGAGRGSGSRPRRGPGGVHGPRRGARPGRGGLRRGGAAGGRGERLPSRPQRRRGADAHRAAPHAGQPRDHGAGPRARLRPRAGPRPARRGEPRPGLRPGPVLHARASPTGCPSCSRGAAARSCACAKKTKP